MVVAGRDWISLLSRAISCVRDGPARGALPRSLISCVQPRSNSWISSGATSVRAHPSSHLVWRGASSGAAAVFLEDFSRWKTRFRNDIVMLRGWSLVSKDVGLVFVVVQQQQQRDVSAEPAS